MLDPVAVLQEKHVGLLYIYDRVIEVNSKLRKIVTLSRYFSLFPISWK
jgi:hypothetical protein